METLKEEEKKNKEKQRTRTNDKGNKEKRNKEKNKIKKSANKVNCRQNMNKFHFTRMSWNNKFYQKISNIPENRFYIGIVI